MSEGLVLLEPVFIVQSQESERWRLGPPGCDAAL